MNHPRLPLAVCSASGLRSAAANMIAAGVAAAGSASSAVLLNEDFNYADQAALLNNWTVAATPLTLDTTTSNPIANHSGGLNVWKGTAISVAPTDAAPLRLTADIFSSGNANQANTIGLRGGINPLFEMGMYRSFDNLQTGPSTTEITTATDGIGIRALSIATDLPGQDWVKMGPNYEGWARFETVFTSTAVTTRVDLGIDGSWDYTYGEAGSTPTGTFTELRVHSPISSLGGGFGVDNIVLETIPEPSGALLIGLGGGIALLRRRRK